MHRSMKVTSREASRARLAIRIAIPTLGLVGMGISGYLTHMHYRWAESICLPGLDCNSVLFSPYAQVWGLPVSLVGFLMYVFLTASGLMVLCRQEGAPLVALGLYTLALSGMLYSVYLTYLEAFKIHAFCSWCLGSSLVITSILVLSIINLSASGLRFTKVPSLTHRLAPALACQSSHGTSGNISHHYLNKESAKTLGKGEI